MVDLLPTLRRGDVVQVTWRDIAEDPTGDPDRAALASGRNTLGFFWGDKQDATLNIPCIVLTNTLDHDVVGQGGYSIFPVALIQSIQVIRRVIRRSRNAAKRNPKQQPLQHPQGEGAVEGAGHVGGGGSDGGEVG